jgi:predicted MPP superfamily phosphohydrolase
MADDGAGLVLAGHTHGGQICVPGYGALLTNCDLPPAQAKGLSRHARAYQPGGDPALGGVDGRGAFLHVSAGLGTSPYAPVRFACPPEATLMTLRPRQT